MSDASLERVKRALNQLSEHELVYLDLESAAVARRLRANPPRNFWGAYYRIEPHLTELYTFLILFGLSEIVLQWVIKFALPYAQTGENAILQILVLLLMAFYALNLVVLGPWFIFAIVRRVVSALLK
jgi:hypothetical protein